MVRPSPRPSLLRACHPPDPRWQAPRLTLPATGLKSGVFPAQTSGSEPLEEAIQKADVLIEALAWIRQFRGKITVIKLGGSVMEDPHAMIHLLVDVVFMETVGMRPVVVHGGGAAINRAMAEAGLQPRFVQGRRYTDADTLAIVERVLAGEVNEQITRRINELGGQAQPLCFRTKNVLFGRRITIPTKTGQPPTWATWGPWTASTGTRSTTFAAWGSCR